MTPRLPRAGLDAIIDADLAAMALDVDASERAEQRRLLAGLRRDRGRVAD